MSRNPPAVRPMGASFATHARISGLNPTDGLSLDPCALPSQIERLFGPQKEKPLLAGPASNSGLVPNRGLSSKPTSGPVNKGLMVLSHLLLFEDSAAMIERVIWKCQVPLKAGSHAVPVVAARYTSNHRAVRCNHGMRSAVSPSQSRGQGYCDAQ